MSEEKQNFGGERSFEEQEPGVLEAKVRDASSEDPLCGKVRQLLQVVARLRGPGGCPWDQKQTHQTIRYHAVEEAYELVEAVEAEDDPALKEELGDLLLQVVFHSQLAQERGAFTFQDVVERLVAKLIHRHPHVFGDVEIRTVEALMKQWDRLKAEEKRQEGRKHESVLDGIPKALPALMRAERLWKRAVRSGLTREEDAVLPEGFSLPKEATAEQAAQALWALARWCRDRGWSPEELLQQRLRQLETTWREREAQKGDKPCLSEESGEGESAETV